MNAKPGFFADGHVLTTGDFRRFAGGIYPGYMTWWGAMAWADQLSYGGFDDWRLPVVTPVNGSAFDYNYAYDGSTDVGYNIGYPGTAGDTPGAYPGSTASEFASMFYVTLGGLGYVDVEGYFRSTGYGWTHAGPFQNLPTTVSWLGTEYGPSPDSAAWVFTTYYGHGLGGPGVQGAVGKDDSIMGVAWAVRPGDVPLPGAGLLFASALVGLGWAHRRR